MEQSNGLKVLDSIDTSVGYGPIYGGREIICSGMNDFYVTDSKGTESQKRIGKRIHIDGVTVTALPISMFGFSLEDFSRIALNEFGLKEVAKSDNETLVVTANSLFVIYSGGLPSLQGLPSKVSVVSRIWKDSEGFIKAPPFSLFSSREMNQQTILNIETSFREIPYEVLSETHLVRTSLKTDVEENNSFNCLHFSGSEDSAYLNQYPRFTPSELSYYKMLFKVQTGSQIITDELEPLIIRI